MRIVSLFSSASYVLRALGLEGETVGVSYCCPIKDKEIVVRPARDLSGLPPEEIDRYIQERAAKREPIYTLEEERIRMLRPDLILAQSLCDVCAVSGDDARRLVERLEYRSRLLTLHPHTLDEILCDIEAVGEAAGVAERAARLIGELRARRERVQSALDGCRPKTVVFLEWVRPFISCGHWVPEMVEAAGGRELIGRAGSGARRLSPADLERADPDFLFVAPCGLSLEEAVRAGAVFDEMPEASRLKAVREGRLFALEPTLFSEHGPEVFDGIVLLAGLLHPERYRADPRRYRRIGARREAPKKP